jgi:hypothetical protein
MGESSRGLEQTALYKIKLRTFQDATGRTQLVERQQQGRTADLKTIPATWTRGGAYRVPAKLISGRLCLTSFRVCITPSQCR